MLYGSVIGGPMLYKKPSYRSSKIFVTRLFWRIRNHTFDGHISGLEQDRDNLKPRFSFNCLALYCCETE